MHLPQPNDSKQEAERSNARVHHHLVVSHSRLTPTPPSYISINQASIYQGQAYKGSYMLLYYILDECHSWLMLSVAW